MTFIIGRECPLLLRTNTGFTPNILSGGERFMDKQRKITSRKRYILLAVALLLALSGLAGCGKSYRVDYCGQKDAYSDAKESYRAGERVKLNYYMIGTDTDYSFYLDGEKIDFDFDDEQGFVIEFTMPDHDVTLKCEEYNTMTPNADPVGSEVTEDLDAGDGWFVWDLNGDGVLEEFSVDRSFNGDEAPDAGVITRVDDGSTAYIDRFYGIETITDGEDENGRYLEITFFEGDYYGQSPGAKCILRDVNGELDIRRVSEKEPGAFFDFMDDYMSQQFYHNFDGDYFPVSVTDAAMGEPAYEITDKDAIKEIFEALEKVQVGGQTDNVWLDGDRWVTFHFKNGDEKIYLFYGDEQVYFENFVYEIVDNGGLFDAIERADRHPSTTESEGIGGGS